MFHKSTAVRLLLVVWLSGCVAYAYAGSSEVTSAAAQCTIDLDFDGQVDTVVLIENQEVYELVALLKRDAGYQAFVLSTARQRLELSCVRGASVTGTAAGPGRRTGTVYNTGGSYVVFAQPEGAAAAYFWRRTAFVEVWIAD